jgi:hypothetical protein
MPETLDTLGAKIDRLATRIDNVDTRLSARIDALATRIEDVNGGVLGRIDDAKTAVLVRIEGVDAKVDLALEKIDHLVERDAANTSAHERFEQRLDNHELRLIALEKRPLPPRSKNR